MGSPGDVWSINQTPIGNDVERARIQEVLEKTKLLPSTVQHLTIQERSFGVKLLLKILHDCANLSSLQYHLYGEGLVWRRLELAEIFELVAGDGIQLKHL